VQELGLTVPYMKDNATHRYIRNILALPFIPAQEIRRVFEQLKAEAVTDSLKNLVLYVEQQWIKSSSFPPEEWSVYGQVVCTNNDIEGWHNALNQNAGGRVHLPFYLNSKRTLGTWTLKQMTNNIHANTHNLKQQRFLTVLRRKSTISTGKLNSLHANSNNYSSNFKTLNLTSKRSLPLHLLVNSTQEVHQTKKWFVGTIATWG